jgi:outer membrane protein assembly factor BamB
MTFLYLSGCGSWIGTEEEIVDPPAELTEFEPSVVVDELWDKGTGSGTDEQYLMLAPVVVDQKIYVADTNSKLTAIDAGSGRNLWTYQPRLNRGGFWSGGDEVTITAGPGYGDNTLLVGTNKGDVAAVNAETGEELWKAKVSSMVLSAPQISNGIVIVRTLDGKIYGLNAGNGRRLWTYDQTVPPLTLHGTSAPVIAESAVICGFDGGRLTAIDINSGRLLWETSIDTPSGRSELERLVDIDAAPVVIEGIVYAVTFQGQLAALTLNTGRLLWNRELSSHAGFTIEGDNIFITDDKSNVWAIDRLNGSAVWKQEGLLNRQVTGPAVIGNYVVVGDFEGYLHWLDKYTGAFSARQRITDERIIAAPVTSAGTLYAYATDGRLAALTYR